MAGWHHRLNGHGFGWTPGGGDGQGGLACCDSWGLKELDTTERLTTHTHTHTHVARASYFISKRRSFLLFPAHRSYLGFPAGSDGKESTCIMGDLGLIPGLGRYPGGGHGNPLKYSCLDRGA